MLDARSSCSIQLVCSSSLTLVHSRPCTSLASSCTPISHPRALVSLVSVRRCLMYCRSPANCTLTPGSTTREYHQPCFRHYQLEADSCGWWVVDPQYRRSVQCRANWSSPSCHPPLSCQRRNILQPGNTQWPRAGNSRPSSSTTFTGNLKRFVISGGVQVARSVLLIPSYSGFKIWPSASPLYCRCALIWNSATLTARALAVVLQQAEPGIYSTVTRNITTLRQVQGEGRC